MKLFKTLLLLLPLLCALTAHTQDHSMDSLQKILKIIKTKLGNKKAIPGFDKKIPGLDTDIPDLDSNFISAFTQKQIKQAFESLNKGLSTAKAKGDLKKLQGGYYDLTKLDSTTGNYKQAYEHYKLYTLYRDSFIKEETVRKDLQTRMQFEFDKKQAVARAEQDKKDAEQRRIKNIQYFTIGTLILLLLVIILIASIQWRNNNQKKKANTVLQQQKEKVEDTLTELKSTQAQLIQSEKMASLGELTAGIAHEIQNPLNFVNNFSEVNKELLMEMKVEIEKGAFDEVRILASDVIDNEEKINHHGKRADAIVKGMLQHSRSSSGVKEPTDINALADEYLRLAYHGLRAKDKTFNAIMKTDYDPAIGDINIIPQDIGRVILNLITNAFYAVNERWASTGSAGGTSTGSAATPYEPTVTVSTALIPRSGARGPQVQIKVADNGGGIPQKIMDKIFQPFFTTKPTGQGTGLGLSLSYDIVKAHGGELKVETKKARPPARAGTDGDDPVGRGEGSEFIVILPVI